MKNLKQPKIKQITTSISNDMIFTYGLGKDGKVYYWDVLQCLWFLHQQKPADSPSSVLEKAQ